jgi:hypothetical protein
MLRPLTAFHTKSAMVAFRPRPQRTTLMTTLRFQHDSGNDRLPVLEANTNLMGKTLERIELSEKTEFNTVKFELKKEVKEVKTELEEVRTELKKDIGSLKTDLKVVQTELKKDIGSMKTHLEAVHTVLKAVETVLKEVKTEFKEVKTELKEVKTELKEEDIGSLKTAVYTVLGEILDCIEWFGKQIYLFFVVCVVYSMVGTMVGGMLIIGKMSLPQLVELFKEFLHE